MQQKFFPKLVSNKEDFYKTDFEKTIQLFEMCLNNNVKSVIFISTVAVYDNYPLINEYSIKAPNMSTEIQRYAEEAALEMF
ncbi:NAD-dependent epimerase/dehydratase family protein [Paenibacillus tianjinensis]|uniref:NAD-dependent epimerase/dehydratase family protein n=1 Tax=Paenibacillus tianjinensis TaxID=2810347 RepID=A0ABX7L7D0_9BACL|nr:NAD-dependent epimerase/dehydratase family protein [Paenibacillus tianjinensis]